MSFHKNFRELEVYRGAMHLVMEIFRLTRSFPGEERFSLTDQIRRSSRAVCAKLAEVWRKRRYIAAFVSKLNDAEAEAAETQVWLEVASRSGHRREADFQRLDQACEKVLGQLVGMADQPHKWVIGPKPKS